MTEDGLDIHLHAYGTNIEGEWEAVFTAIRGCHAAVHRMGTPRITTTLKFGTRTDRDQRMADKVRSVAAKRGASRPGSADAFGSSTPWTDTASTVEAQTDKDQDACESTPPAGGSQ